MQEIHVQQTIVRQQHEYHGRIIAIQEKNLATRADNQKSQQYRNAIAEKQLMAFEKQQKTLESALRSEKNRAFKKDIEARVRLLEQDVKTGMIDVNNLKKERSLLKQTFMQHCKSCEGQANQDYKADTKLTKRGSLHLLTALIVIPKGALILKQP
jgi:hypothetical protein